MASKHKRGLTATNLAAYHHFQCDLFLHSTYHSPIRHGPDVSGLPELSELTKATFTRGNNWEASLFTWLDNKGLLLQVYGGFLDEDGIREVIEVDDRTHFFVAGLSFLPPAEAFKKRFIEYGQEPVHFGVAKPDLVEIKKEADVTLWRVVDAKSSGNVKTPHHVQIYFYHKCLEYLLGTSHYRPMGTSGIWIPPTNRRTGNPSYDGLHSISIPLLSSALDEFLLDKLPALMSKPRREVEWHFNPLCRGCPFEKECANWAEEEGRLGTIPDISLQDAAILRNLLGLVRSKTVPPRLTDIEELDETLHSKVVMQDLTHFHPSTVKKAKRILKLTDNLDDRGAYSSPSIDATRTQRVKVLGRRILNIPSEEDIALVISLVLDPATDGIAAYCITMFTDLRGIGYREPLCGLVENLLFSLYQVMQHILDLNDVLDVPPRTQCYMFSLSERAALQRFLINIALTADPEDDDLQEQIRVCIGALCEGAALLATSFQPMVLSGALLDFLGKRGERSTDDLKTCLRRLGLPTVGNNNEELRQRIETEIDRLKKQGKRTSGGEDNAGDERSTSRPEIGQLPRITVLKKSIERLLALPVPGYWDLCDCHRLLATRSRLQCPSDDDIYSRYISGRADDLHSALRTRNTCLYESLTESRDLIFESNIKTKDILVNEARVLSSEFMDICKQDHLRKIFFMQQFEVLSKLQTLWKDRIDGCIEAPRLKYHYTHELPNGFYVHHFSLTSGYIDLPSDKEISFFEYILTEDTDVYSDIPAEALFDDLAVFNVFFPLNNFTKSRWSKQHRIVQNKILIADVQDIHIVEGRTMVTLRTFGAFTSILKGNSVYRLSHRLVDFNVTKILSTLVEIDLQTPPSPDYVVMPSFLQLIAHTWLFANQRSEWESVSDNFLKTEVQIQSMFKQIEGLDGQAAAALMLKASQRRALRRILGYRLSVIWGPPGTGKTYTISLSLLRFLEVRHKCEMHTPLCIYLTAMTHAAIEACLSKIRTLMQKYRSIPGLNTAWLNGILLERVLVGGNHPLPSDDKTHIFAGTVYQLYNFSRRSKIQADCIIIDEAGQLGLGPASIVLRSLKSNGRVIVAGDSEQLAPILASQYPQAESRLFGSILDSLVNLTDTAEDDRYTYTDSATTSFSDTAEVSTVVQLTENFRLNPDLGDFVSTIYKRSFKPQKTQTRKVVNQLSSLETVSNISAVQDQARDILVALSAAMLRRKQSVLRPPVISRTKNNQSNASASAETFDISGIDTISLALIRLSVSAEFPDQFGYESHVRGEASLAAALVRLIQTAAPEESIFVATPHRIQRHAVKDALRTKFNDLAEAFGSLNIGSSTGAPSFSDKAVTVDTIERLQGSEAAFVICLFSHTHLATASTAIDFLLERRRLNVAISRAKTLCILVTSQEILKPSVRIFSNPTSAKGFAFLKAFEDRAWVADVNIDLDFVNNT